jgi:hypothetical protein
MSKSLPTFVTYGFYGVVAVFALASVGFTSYTLGALDERREQSASTPIANYDEAALLNEDGTIQQMLHYTVTLSDADRERAVLFTDSFYSQLADLETTPVLIHEQEYRTDVQLIVSASVEQYNHLVQDGDIQPLTPGYFDGSFNDYVVSQFADKVNAALQSGEIPTPELVLNGQSTVRVGSNDVHELFALPVEEQSSPRLFDFKCEQFGTELLNKEAVIEAVKAVDPNLRDLQVSISGNTSIIVETDLPCDVTIVPTPEPEAPTPDDPATGSVSLFNS